MVEVLIEQKPPKISGQGTTLNFPDSGILPLGTPKLCDTSKSFGRGCLYTNNTTELTKVSLIILASDAQSLHFSPLTLRFEQGFILAWARETQ